MRYFDEQLVANSRPHQQWWGEVSMAREHFHRSEDVHANLYGELNGIANASAVLPRDAWLDLDTITRTVLRDDGGEVYMNDLMALAKPVHIGKLVHLSRVASDSANPVIRSMTGQVAVPMDKVVYDYRGAPVPIFSAGYGREWREWNTLQSENFDALADDQEAAVDKLKRDQAAFVLDGDATITFQGYGAKGIRTSTLSKAINLGSAVGGANIDLTASATTADAIDTFFTQTLGAMLDANLITGPVNIYVSPEIARNLDRSYSSAAGYKDGSLLDQLLKNPRINKIVRTFKLTGNQFFGFVPKAEFIRPLVGMAVNTTAMARPNPTDNYQFLVMGALGIEIRADYNNKSGVFYSTDVD
ncbi:major capsid protein [Brevundimonas sp. Root1279]|uniref:major capsid protein n=1 Tax=Brevundimonas sp. Root1279 TaxID=1736443 RepID=UPI0006F99DBA|nr:major capsid protein [Brevundimonas sp. Root1279]KQW79723.1 coat protein [Brevundimonas sp. Root1279]